ncbi:MAG: tetratricopeptide repeat protein [Myxococcales bacterium]|nr:tetratricopeptide repeat protein [Myxococcales bacterium]
MPLQPGQSVGRYELVAELGRGGMGVVWEAVLLGPQGFRKPVALKVLHPKRYTARFERNLMEEARIGARLQHPHIVSTLELGSAEMEGRSLWFVAMELVRGLSTRKLLEHGPLPAKAALRVALDTAAALTEIHALRGDGPATGHLVHRDIKPDNLLVDRSGAVKVTDLGLAQLSGTGGVGYTPGYAPPEQWSGKEDHRADLFALGATLFELISGEPAFSRRTPQSEADLRGRLPWITEWAAETMPGLDALLARCLSLEPGQRYGSASVLHGELNRLWSALTGPGLFALLARVRPDLTNPSSTPSGPRTGGSLPSLPPERDPFFGRQAEIAEAQQALQEHPFVTLLGTAGVGKTRLAVHLARELSSTGRVCFVDASDATTEQQLCGVVSRAFGWEPGTDSAVDWLGAALNDAEQVVLILDNLEQVATEAAQVLARWNTLAPGARFLLTSRVALHLRGEHVVQLGPMRVADAVELFRERATRPLTSADGDLVSFVEQLEGLPLAIELAAARTRLMSVPQMESELHRRLQLLAVPRSDRPARHRSLVAALHGTTALLSPPARQALAQLSVFESGFELAAAEAVLALEDPAVWAIDVLEELVDSCMLRAHPEVERFSMLVVVQQYAATQLSEAEGAEAEARHAAHYARLGSDASIARLAGPGGHERYRRQKRDLENLVAACHREVAAGRGPTAAGAARAAWSIYLDRGPLSAGAALLEHALTTELPPDRRAALLVDLGSATRRLGRTEAAIAALTEARQLAEQIGDDRRAITAVGALAKIQQAKGELADALQLNEHATALCGDDRRSLAYRSRLLLDRGHIHKAMGRPHEAHAAMQEALQLAVQLGDDAHRCMVLGSLGDICLHLDRLTDAHQHLQQAVAVARATDHRNALGVALGTLGRLCLRMGKLDEAYAMHQQALALHEEMGDQAGQGIEQGSLAQVAWARGDQTEARTRFDTSIEILERTGPTWALEEVRRAEKLTQQ